jgi:drug/metabolite transporter (DMT)-like permease
VTRHLIAGADPITLAILRWGIGFLFAFPAALLMRANFPPRSDWLPVVPLGVCFFGLFVIFYNIALAYTTAARSTLPLQTMIVGALLDIEPLTVRKTLGVAIAMLGVFAALASGLNAATEGPWRGEAMMAGAVLCNAFYNV